ncbi:MAG TPA: diguanylate cyclase [Nocardioidaceae bacterium]|nr:diguanylate cyclase [Nocardioidaceae bacterium]
MDASAKNNDHVAGVLTRASATVGPAPSPPAQGPAFVAGQRTPPRDGTSRGYPAVRTPYDPTGASVVLAATRALLTATTRTEVAQVLHTAVQDLGGAVVPARSADASAIPVDVSLGVGEPQVVIVDEMHPASLGLSAHLPSLVEDALTSAARCEGDRRRPVRVTLDAPPRPASRSAAAAGLGDVSTGDVVCLVDLDQFPLLVEAMGAQAAVAAFERCGTLLRTHVRTPGDFVGRSHGQRFLVVLAGAPLDVACDRMRQVALAWMAEHQASLSIGVAVCSERGAAAAQDAAHRALQRAKKHGRNRVAVATSEDVAGSQD